LREVYISTPTAPGAGRRVASV